MNFWVKPLFPIKTTTLKQQLNSKKLSVGYVSAFGCGCELALATKHCIRARFFILFM